MQNHYDNYLPDCQGVLSGELFDLIILFMLILCGVILISDSFIGSMMVHTLLFQISDFFTYIGINYKF